ncbi:hypothetical protein [Sphingobacterium corticibacter]|uniref:Uncharacterized protein n=1 Tax=Sphingobacterium corticibacter TaxID=2171749 RepID=A0A2T8HJL2_9SPHI|nr:hypothetical protein [Sphingobacterium corticibacter]PVH25502.1 hypothetical protein DC487_06010 [Sphingobacterium corticibacter]
MHYATFVFITLLQLVLISGQSNHEKNIVAINKDPKELLDSLKKHVDQSWISENPSFQPTQSSFFNKENEKNYYVAGLQISGVGVPFMWDSNLSLLKRLLEADPQIQVKQNADADPMYAGTKVHWNKPISALIWIEGAAQEATVDHWYLISNTDCPGTITFPTISFDKEVAIPAPHENSLDGLTIFPYDDRIHITSHEIALTTIDNQSMTGIGYDLNDDDILDIFTYTEEINETTSYIRLYINVNGVWKCTWIHLDEVCI